MVLEEPWRACFSALRLPVPENEEFTGLIGRYAEAHRAYHTRQHLDECFGAFETVRGSAQSPGAVGLALFYHDAIYDTHAHDNEEKSADLARQMLGCVGGDAALLSYVTDLILVTRHAAMPDTDDQKAGRRHRPLDPGSLSRTALTSTNGKSARNIPGWRRPSFDRCAARSCGNSWRDPRSTGRVASGTGSNAKRSKIFRARLLL